MLDDENSRYVSFHRILDVPWRKDPGNSIPLNLKIFTNLSIEGETVASTIPSVEVVVKRDSEKCWDVLKHMEQQGLPPNNVACPMQRWGQQGRAPLFLQGVSLCSIGIVSLNLS